MNETLTNILYLLFGLVLAAVIIKYPYLGVVFTVSSLSIIDLLPSIGMFDTVLPLIGGVSFVGFVLQLKKNEKITKKSINFVFIFAVLFIMWMYRFSLRFPRAGYQHGSGRLINRRIFQVGAQGSKSFCNRRARVLSDINTK